MNKDIRWEQRFSNYKKALSNLKQAIDILESKKYKKNNEGIADELERVIKEGLIQRFEYTFELSWNVMKDYAEYQGIFEVKGSRDAIREAFKMNLINNAESWMDMIKSRVNTAHSYDEDTINEIIKMVINVYSELFCDFEKTMENLRTKN